MPSSDNGSLWVGGKRLKRSAQTTSRTAMVGHKTESIYRRYAIVDEAMLKEGACAVQVAEIREGNNGGLGRD